jgi:hypothetical protein
MIRTERIEQRNLRTSALRCAWLLLCLLAAVASFLPIGHAMPAHADNPALLYANNAADADSGCEGAHALPGGHCCAGVACAAYAQLETPSATPDEVIGRYPLPSVQDVHISRSPRPNPQPPKRSSQA